MSCWLNLISAESTEESELREMNVRMARSGTRPHDNGAYTVESREESLPHESEIQSRHRESNLVLGQKASDQILL